MPIYEYVCHECSTEFDDIKSVKNRKKAECPTCGDKCENLLSLGARPVVLGYFDQDLQTHITGPSHRDKVCKEKGISFITKQELNYDAVPKPKKLTEKFMPQRGEF